MRQRLYDFDALATQLFDALADHPDGFTIHEISALLEIPRQTANMVIRTLRLTLGQGDSITVPYRVDGRQRRYFLASQVEALVERNNIRQTTYASNMETEIAMWQAVKAQTNGRTVEGRKARLYLKYWTRLSEDINELAEL